MYGKLYKNVKDLFYILTFLLIIIYRWIVINPIETFNIYISTVIYFEPAIMLCILFFFSYRYFDNNFISTRIGTKEAVLRKHYYYVTKETITFALWQLILIFILGFEKLNITTIASFLVVAFTVISSYLVLTSIYFVTIIYFHKFNYSFVVNCLLILFYKFYVTWWLMLGSYQLDFNNISQNFILIIINMTIISILSLLIYRKIYKVNINYNKYSSLYVYIIYAFIEIISVYSLISYQISWQSFSLDNLFIVNNSDFFLCYIFWIAPKLFIFIFSFYYFCNNYKHNLIFYMTRIRNRKKWVAKIILSITRYIIAFSMIKIIITCLLYSNFSFELFSNTFIYIIYLLFIVLIEIIAYLLTKDDSIINTLIILYLIIGFIGFGTKMEFLDIFLIKVSLLNIFIYVSTLIICSILIVYKINNDEYYGS